MADDRGYLEVCSEVSILHGLVEVPQADGIQCTMLLIYLKLSAKLQRRGRGGGREGGRGGKQTLMLNLRRK